MRESRPLEHVHVLLVEDDGATSELFAFLLETYGAYITTAASVQAGIAQVEIMAPDIIISDMNSSDGSSKDLLNHLRNSPQQRLQQIPVIAITDTTRLGESQVAREVKAAGFQGCLAKPINSTQLLQLILTLLPRQA